MFRKAFAAVAVAGALTACAQPAPIPPRPSQPMQTSTQNTGYYCDTVEKTGGKHDEMKKLEATLSDRIRYQGIPLTVVEANRNYFNEFEAKTTIQLGQDYVKIIEACRATGWKLPSERQPTHS